MGLLKLLDLKCIPCPLNVVKVKLALEKLPANQDLIIELDKGEPQQMVQKTLKEMGYLFKKIEEDKNSLKIKIFNEG